MYFPIIKKIAQVSNLGNFKPVTGHLAYAYVRESFFNLIFPSRFCPTFVPDLGTRKRRKTSCWPVRNTKTPMGRQRQR